jgi:hypothetical protein
MTLKTSVHVEVGFGGGIYPNPGRILCTHQIKAVAMPLLPACAAVGLGLAIAIKYEMYIFTELSDMCGVQCAHSCMLGSSNGLF